MSSLPISRIFGEKLDAGWFQKNGFNVEFWDLTPLFWSKENLDQYYSGCENYRYIGPNHKIFTHLDEVKYAISTLTQDVMVWNLSRYFKLVKDDWIFEELNRKSILYYLQHFDTDIESSNLYIQFKNYINLYRQRFLNKRLKPYGIIGSGSIGRIQSMKLFPNAHFISVPSIKVLWQKAPPMIRESYNLFVDENIAYPPDARLLGYEICLNPDAYYSRLNRLFDDIELWSGRPVIIAASGKYQYEQDRFNGRQLIYSQTLPLIQNANFVIGHMSLALDQCLVSEKSFLLIDDPDFTKIKRKGFSESLLGLMGRPILVTKVTKEVYLQGLSFNTKRAKSIVSNYLKEDDVTLSYHSILEEEICKSGKSLLQK